MTDQLAALDAEIARLRRNKKKHSHLVARRERLAVLRMGTVAVSGDLDWRAFGVRIPPAKPSLWQRVKRMFGA